MEPTLGCSDGVGREPCYPEPRAPRTRRDEDPCDVHDRDDPRRVLSRRYRPFTDAPSSRGKHPPSRDGSEPKGSTRDHVFQGAHRPACEPRLGLHWPAPPPLTPNLVSGRPGPRRTTPLTDHEGESEKPTPPASGPAHAYWTTQWRSTKNVGKGLQLQTAPISKIPKANICSNRLNFLYRWIRAPLQRVNQPLEKFAGGP